MRQRVSVAATLALLAATGVAPRTLALELQPTTLQMAQGQAQGELWLGNPGPEPWAGRIEILHWVQTEGRDALQPSADVVASPALPRLPGGTRQRIRLVLPHPLPAGVERAYRVLVEPTDPRLPRYSLPLFITPAGPNGKATLQAGVQRRTADAPCLYLHNAGLRSARLADLDFVDRDGGIQVLQSGLAGYVLPGASVCWDLPQRADHYAGGRFQARRNGADTGLLAEIAVEASSGL